MVKVTVTVQEKVVKVRVQEMVVMVWAQERVGVTHLAAEAM